MGYYVVEVVSLSRERVDGFVNDWRKNYRWGLLKDASTQIVVEKRVGNYIFVVLVRGTLLGLWIVLKIEELARKHGVSVIVHESTSIIIDERYVDRVLKERIEKIPPHLVHDIRRTLLERKLPRGRRREEVIEAMKV